MRPFARFVTLFGLACAAATAAPAFSIEQVISTPFASSLVAAPKGNRVAWVLNIRGRRNLWTAQSPDWKAAQLTHFDDDDGLEISEPTWTPDGKSLLFTRGADLESERGDPNPTAAITPTEHAIWLAAIDHAHVVVLSPGDGATVPPLGQRVWFLRKGQVFSAKLDGSDPKHEFQVQGSAVDLTWSPDGRQLAFVNHRGDHSYIGVFTPGTPKLRFLDPSVDTDDSPVWSPDGTSVAFVRQPAAPTRPLFGARREGYPWSIRGVALSSNRSVEIFRAAAGPGSIFHALDSPKQLFWTAENNLVFPWEQTGWLHLYRVSSTTQQSAAELTPGEGEVENVALSPDRRTLFYSSNLGDLDHRHLARVSPDQTGAAPVVLTSGKGVEWSPVPVAETQSLALLASTFNASAHAELLSLDGQRTVLARTSVPAEFPAAELIEPESVLLPSADGLVLHAQLFRPHGAGKHPALVFFHGGSRRQMLPAFHYMYYYSNSYAMNQWLASQGYVVLAINYRSGIGYGLNFREALNYGASGASEYNDVQGAGLYLRNRNDVDPKRVGAWGGSYGGYLTALALARSSDLYAAGVDFHGVHDWNFEFISQSPGDEQAREQWERLAFSSSPLAFVDTWKSPVLLIHGDDDRNVAFTQTIRLVEALRNHNVPCEQLIFPNEIHDFLLWQDWLSSYTAAGEFFSRKLTSSK